MLRDTFRTRYRNLRRNVLRRWAKTSQASYFGVLGMVVAVAAATVILGGQWNSFERKTFDLAMRSRILAPAPDPSIVLLNIDERSLAEMAAEYGRWPWPRRILGETIEYIEAQGPRAIVLDILIADPDVHNPSSEAAFEATVRKAPHVFYSAVRLPAQYDAASTLKVSQVPGAIGQGEAPTVAMLLPYMEGILATGRVGTINLLSDRDGIAREAWLRQPVGEWKLPSVPYLVARQLGYPLPDRDRILINWRGPPGTYPIVSFADVYRDSLRRIPQRPRDEFAGKIVMIGSSAAGLFDLRATPMSPVTPGTEILATALDNVMHDDAVRSAPTWLTALLTVVMVLGIALAFALDRQEIIRDRSFFVLQIAVGAAALGTLHFSPVYIDASAPITFGTLFFAIARFSMSSRSRADTLLLRERLTDSPHTALILRARLEEATPRDLRQAIRLLSAAAKRSPLNVTRLLPPSDSLRLLEKAHEGTIAQAWFAPAGGADEASAGEALKALAENLGAFAAQRGLRLTVSISQMAVPPTSDATHSAILQSLFASVFNSEESKHQESKHES